MEEAPPDGAPLPVLEAGPSDPRAATVSTRPGDGALSRVDAVKDEHLRRWDVATPAATLIGRPEAPDADVSGTVRQLHEEAHPAMTGHGARMHRLDKARITHALCSTLGVTPWERDRALGIVTELDLTAFGSQRAVETVALVVLKHVVDRERRRRLGLHDGALLDELSPDDMERLYERFESLTDDDRYRELLAANDLDVTAVNRLERTLREQLDEQDLADAVHGRSPHRDPALPAIRDLSGSDAGSAARSTGAPVPEESSDGPTGAPVPEESSDGPTGAPVPEEPSDGSPDEG